MGSIYYTYAIPNRIRFIPWQGGNPALPGAEAPTIAGGGGKATAPGTCLLKVIAQYYPRMNNFPFHTTRVWTACTTAFPLENPSLRYGSYSHSFTDAEPVDNPCIRFASSMVSHRPLALRVAVENPLGFPPCLAPCFFESSKEERHG